MRTPWSASKAEAAEVAAYIRTRHGLPVEARKRGELFGLPIRVKVSARTIEALDKITTDAEAAATGAPSICIITRPDQPIEHAHAVVNLQTLAALIVQAKPEWQSLRPLTAEPGPPLNIEKTCGWCGGTYTRTNGRQKFCTRSCRERSARQRLRDVAA